ncbi:hypothetical protein PENSPDRAFT_172131 [Peniophora sp. CONT]|nr:hypothetical protein PENSPDRAFT_172131 [Peniophora sp. CONT]
MLAPKNCYRHASSCDASENGRSRAREREPRCQYLVLYVRAGANPAVPGPVGLGWLGHRLEDWCCLCRPPAFCFCLRKASHRLAREIRCCCAVHCCSAGDVFVALGPTSRIGSVLSHTGNNLPLTTTIPFSLSCMLSFPSSHPYTVLSSMYLLHWNDTRLRRER